MKRYRNFFLSSLLVLLPLTGMQASGRDHLAPTPPMGWMTWNMYAGNINEQLVKQVADVMVAEGYLEAGYQYIFIDDLWQGGRDKFNNIVPDPEKFPSGIKALADYVHVKGLKLGIYSDAASLTCAGVTGSLNFEDQDARTFASWGIDYLKYDYCNAPSDSAEAHRRYARMAQALTKSGRDIAFGVCEWGQLHPELWAHQAGGQLWRTTYDVRDMWSKGESRGAMGIYDIIKLTVPLSQYAGPGRWNDMDMLVVGLEGKGGPSSDLGGKGCSYIEYQSQMSMWAMLASPLAMSHDILSTSAEARRILLNKEVIAIDQDPMGVAARQVLTQRGCDIYMRPLADNRTAVAILNASDKETHVKLIFNDLGLKGRYAVRDVWAHRIVSAKAQGWKGKLRPHETIVLVLQ